MALYAVKIDKHTKETFSVFTGMNGKFTRFKIVQLIKDRPLNTQQISKELNYDYKSIKHSLKVLEQNNLIQRVGTGYGDIFFLTDTLTKNYDYFLQHIDKVKKKFDRKKVYIE